MPEINVTPALRALYPTAPFGVLVTRDFLPQPGADFNTTVAHEIAVLRARYLDYTRQAYIRSEPACHYVRYYKRFKKSYHIMLQLESILLKGKTSPETLPLVRALLLAEVKHSLITGGFDLDTMQPPFTLDAAVGGESYLGASGEAVVLSAGDVYLRDGLGIVISIIYGQDSRTRFTPATRNVLWVTDGVEGVTPGQVQAHLEDLLAYLRVFDPHLQAETLEVI